MSHFEREAKLQLGFPLVILSTSLVVAVVSATCYFRSQHHAIDRCLDSGGSYDYAARHCDFTASHPPPE